MGQNDQEQGQDPRNEVFQGLAAILYACCGPVDGGYKLQSKTLASMANANGGLLGKRVLDLGCGYGTTSLAIAEHLPAEIVADDVSAQHLELLEKTLLSKAELGEYLESKGALTFMRVSMLDALIQHLEQMRDEFDDGVFSRSGGTLQTLKCSALDLTLEQVPGHKPFDAVLGCNSFHWPVNQRRALYEEKGSMPSTAALNQAMDDTLERLEGVLKPNGILALLEPTDFVSYDTDPKLDQALQDASMVNLRVFTAFHMEINQLLAEQYGITGRKVPTAPLIFRVSRLEAVFRRNGFQLDRVVPVTPMLYANPLDMMFARLPMLLGQVPISFDQKMEVAKTVRSLFAGTGYDRLSVMNMPFFVLLAHKLD
ncbi:MAG: methyltransferase [Patescibacteria group bacterium]